MTLDKTWLTTAPSVVVATEEGEIFDIPELAMAGRSGYEFILPGADELVPMPAGSELYHLPDRVAVGFDRRTGALKTITRFNGKKVLPVSVFVAPAFTLFYLSAFMRTPDANELPLFMYGAVGWSNHTGTSGEGTFVVTACRVDPDIRQDADQFNAEEIQRRAEQMLQKSPQNRLAEHLVKNCVYRYWCPAARNWVLGRWEMPLPTATACNSLCVGCISLKLPNRPHPPQYRIAFTPTPEEIAEIAVSHLESAERPIASFGQGCEGEPLMNPTLLERAIRRIRQQTTKGTINLNTNGSRPEAVARLFQAGLDSIRVSLNSAIPDLYNAYFKPRDYSFADVIETLMVANRMGKFASINYFVFPGITDREEEVEALCNLVETTQIKMIQWRNLNLDPDEYLMLLGERLSRGKSKHLGMKYLLEYLRSRYPHLRFGYFNPPLR
ncbi:MAG: radical SAM protein [Candidatus Sumerlaeia bacterium]|nr:radical SAM protein [Candidatus Sumerlaeia bacterium]